LYLPETWTKDAARRQAAGIPEEVVFRKKWELALDLLDQARGWGLPDRIVLGDAGYGEATEFREGLQERGLRYAVGIAPQAGVWAKAPKIKVPEYSGRGAHPKRWDYGDQRPSSVKDVSLKASQRYLKFAPAGRLSDDLVVKTRTREGDRWRHSQSCLAACCSLYTTVLTGW
jgi:SRSO17 transposase